MRQTEWGDLYAGTDAFTNRQLARMDFADVIETNRDKALRGGVVVVTDNRLREMQQQAVHREGEVYHWHWAAVLNELEWRRKFMDSLERRI